MAKPDPRIETLERDIATLVEQRQTLRATGAKPNELERNRREIVARQQKLSETLISIYAPQPAFAVA
jgi:flagellar motility protein MotE (MotC chaperone)